MGARFEEGSLGGDTSADGRGWRAAPVGREGRLTDGSWRLLKAEVAVEKKRLLLVEIGAGLGAGELSGSLLLGLVLSLPLPFAEAHCSFNAFGSS